MSSQELTLEILTGPLDGLVLSLEEAAEWSKENEGELGFPWDEGLGAPQARFLVQDQSWWLEGHAAPHGTYCVNREGRVEGRIRLEPGDVLRASDTWLLVREV